MRLAGEPKTCFLVATPRTGTLVLGYFGVISSLVGLTAMVGASFLGKDAIVAMCLAENSKMDEEGCNNFAVGALAFLAVEEFLRGIASFLLIVGVERNLSSLMIPYMMLHGMMTVFMGIVFISGVVGYGIYGSVNTSITFAVFGGILIAVMNHLFRVVQACSNEISRQKQDALRAGEPQTVRSIYDDPPPPYKF